MRSWIRPLLCLGVFAGAAHAAPSRHETLHLDSTHSQADFAVKVLWVIPLHGEFGKVHGTIQVDHFRSSARVTARIDTDDLHMRSDRYADWAKSPEFFDAAQFPQIDFSSDAFPLARLHSGGTVDGTLTLRGVARPVRFTIVPAQCATPLSGACPVEAEGSIERRDFGMRSRRATLADKVALHLSIIVTPAPAAAP